MPDSPVSSSRRSSVVAACVATLPRRLLLLGGFVVAGWFALALFGATHASAAPTSGHAAKGNPDAGLQLPLVSVPVSTASHGDPLAATVRGVVAPVRPTLDGLAHALAPVTTPITRGLPKPAPLPAVAPGAPMPSLSDATTTLLADVRAGLAPHSSGPTGLDPLLLPTLNNLLGGAHAVPAPPTPPDRSATHPHPGNGSPADLSRVSNADASGQPRSPSPARPADESLSATPAPASASHGQLAGPGIPAPLPALPPAGPDTVLATGSGSAATSTSGSGAGLSSGYGSADDIRPDATLLGSAESARTRPVRNTANEPPVSPD